MRQYKDMNGSKKCARGLELIKHMERDYVKAMVVGAHGREWVCYYPLADFELANPQMEV